MAGSTQDILISWVEQGRIPDVVIRAGIRQLVRQRLRDVGAGDVEAHAAHTERFVEAMDTGPIALLPEKANEQHYEVPAEFFDKVLGPLLKYSACHWAPGVERLEDAEAAALALTCEHAGIDDGQDILELGCGWGSLTLWLASHYPAARITAVSNSASQGERITAAARRRRLGNVRVITCDMNEFEAPGRYDRVVSVEMFEHMRNYRALYGRIHGWLKPGGRFFKHIFVHRNVPYEYVDQGPADWMSRHFFAGGIMPSNDLPLRFQDDLKFLRRWSWGGTHYEKTANAWLDNLDANRAAVLLILADTYGVAAAEQWLQRWRIFFMSCAELFGYLNGQEWWVSHYLFERPTT